MQTSKSKSWMKGLMAACASVAAKQGKVCSCHPKAKKSRRKGPKKKKSARKGKK